MLKSRQSIYFVVISFFYALMGGVVTCSMYPEDILYGDWWFWGWIITLPANMVSFTIRFTFGISYITVAIIQLIIAMLYSAIGFKIINKKK